jgi:hypothetical protein
MDSSPAGQYQALDAAQIAERISLSGWLKFKASTGHNLEAEVLSLASSLGEPVAGRGGKVVERLAPQATNAAHAKSLSAIHGHGSFPLHTDGAHRLLPPRFLLLACANPGSVPVPTLLQRFSELRLSPKERALCETATFLFRNGKHSFYSTVAGDRPFIRFDEGCMMPLGPDGEAAASAVASSAALAAPIEIQWEAGDIVAVDNWKVLHGRGRATAQASPDRLLFRVSIQ